MRKLSLKEVKLKAKTKRSRKRVKLLAGVKARRASWRTEGSPKESQLGRGNSSLFPVCQIPAYNGATIPKTIPPYGMKLGLHLLMGLYSDLASCLHHHGMFPFLSKEAQKKLLTVKCFHPGSRSSLPAHLELSN